MGAVQTAVWERSAGNFRLATVFDGVSDALNDWIRELRDAGITRWWNDHREPEANAAALSVDTIVNAFGDNVLESLGMSARVAALFRETMTDERQFQLRALRCDDRYTLQLRVSEHEYRNMDELSGGQQVSVLLSLLLESNDSRPLVIDQPEDELDSAYLFRTVLPAVRRLKGRRQLILATHNPNIVVNGDADQVIQLQATHDRGHVEVQGGIEAEDVKRAIVMTVDGGREAFELRLAKYGF